MSSVRSATTAREHFTMVILVSLLNVLLLFSTLVTETSLASSKAVSTPATCLKECNDILADTTKTKAQRVISNCYLLCLKKTKGQQSLTGTKVQEKRIRKALPINNDCSKSSLNQSVDWFPSKVNVSFGQYENTSNWYIYASWTPMNDSNGTWNSILVRLVIPPKDSRTFPVICVLLPKNQTFLSTNISSHGYIYPDKIYLKVLGFPYSAAEDDTYIYPFSPTPATPTELSTLRSDDKATKGVAISMGGLLGPVTSSDTVSLTSPSRFHTQSSSDEKVAKGLAISMGVLVGPVLCVFAVVYFRCKKPIPRLRSDYTYDAFITYSDHDRTWTKKLLHFLEKEHHLKCCVHYRDFYAGRPFVENMAYSIDRSYKVIVVFSRNYLESNYCIYELNLAIDRLARERDGSLVVIRIDDVDPNNLPSELIGNSFIDFANYLERPFWRRKLLEFFRPASSVDYRCDNNNSNHHEGIKRRPPFHRLSSTASKESHISTV